MFKVKKKDTRATSTNCMFIATDVVLVSLFVNSSVFVFNFEQVNSD